MRALVAVSVVAMLACAQAYDGGDDEQNDEGTVDAGTTGADGPSTSVGGGPDAAGGGGGGGGGSSYRLTVTRTGTGSGTITSTPSGLVCAGADCTGTFAAGTTVTLSLSTEAGSSLVAWGGACSGTSLCAPVMSSDVLVTADLVTVLGTWVGTYQNTRPYAGCTFNNSGNWRMTVTASGSTFSANATIDGLELRYVSNCGYCCDAAATTATANASYTSSLSGEHNFYVSEANQYLAFPWTASVTGTTMTGSWTCTGCTGSFTLTRQ